MMTTFIDPRSDPAPPAQISVRTATHGEQLRELVHHCLAGHVYDVERWIQNGRPIQALTYKRPKKAAVVSPMCAAIRTKHRDIVLLLLCNGYRLDLEATDGNSVLNEALTIRAFDILVLLLAWGADPRAVRSCNVVDTYRTELVDQFWTGGVDHTAGPLFS